ncbi:PDZ domain-containing protein GIPC1-like [Mizuhopecten yessoensis]|uniref:PDZ domain-containing protein GIPC1 n=1 Tax=Mizuhopecten yessoensis TaxID=6573 RepID=A0A210PGB1_MIZYE|nr:PDZ domain-containing protein GIPC1-like [Mizuhopecten yessoensis]OWF35522.1 PDZ domain-containing protein GIPC1 [Mizuhopecten yessoensis]
MPLFGKKKDKTLVENQQTARSPPEPNEQRPSNQQPAPPESNGTSAPRSQPVDPPRPKLVFHCQQAHGSPTGIISGFTNVKELYQKIADAYDMDVSDILFCTLNTHKIDMAKLLGGQIGLDDFIFAHIKGRPKELDVTKSEDALGLTITDNGAGYAFIKRIKENSIMDTMPLIAVGDHIEKIDGKNLIGCRHFEVAKMLKEIPKGSTFTIRTVEPLKSGFSNIGPSGGKKGSSKYGSGKETLRIRSSGPATVGIPDDVINVAVDKINGLLESFMGINDSELATTIWEMGSASENPHDFTTKIDESEIKDFGFTDDFIFDLWGAISDAKQGRLQKTANFEEQF